MRKLFNHKEVRDLAFIAIAIFMTILICVTSISSGGLFGIVVSIVLLALLCVGLGYQYCKNEDRISAIMEKVEKPKKEKVQVNIPTIDFEKVAKFVADNEVEANTATEATPEEEVKAVENDS